MADITTNDLLMDLVKKDPAKAIEFITFTGRTKEEAEAFIKTVQDEVAVAAAAEVVETYRAALRKAVEDALRAFDADNAVDPVLIEVKFDLHFTRAKNPDDGKEIGWMVSPVRTKKVGEERLSSGTRKAGGGGNGNGKSVPIPDALKSKGINSWSAHLKAAHPDVYRAMEAKGSQYSAPFKLGKLGDQVYLNAKKARDIAADKESREAAKK